MDCAYKKNGPLGVNPSGGKQRVRDIAYGTVIRAIEKGIWEVRFDFDGRRKSVRNTTLKVVDNDTGIPIEEVDKVALQDTGTEPNTSIDKKISH